MTAGPAHDVGPAEDERAQAPIRWPRPDRYTLSSAPSGSSGC